MKIRFSLGSALLSCALGCDPGGTVPVDSGGDTDGSVDSDGPSKGGGEELPPQTCDDIDALLDLDPSNPAEFGQWSAPVDWSQPKQPEGIRPDGVGDLLPVHLMHLPTGKLLAWSGSGGTQLATRDQFTWDIATNTFEYVPAVLEESYRCSFGGAGDADWIDCDPKDPKATDCVEYCEETCWDAESCAFPVCNGLTPEDLSCKLFADEGPDLFCSGHTHWVDGDPIVQGGNITGRLSGLAPRSLFRFVESAGEWLNLGMTPVRRWYPTMTTLRDSSVTLLGGAGTGNFPLTLINQGTVGPVAFDHPGADPTSSLTYPFMFQMTDGRVFYAGAEEPGDESMFDGYIFNPETVEWETDRFDSSISGGSAVMYAPDKVMKSGGCSGFGDGDGARCQPYQDTEIIDLGVDDEWRTSCPMPQPRHFHTLTLLPDGTVLMTGGNREGNGHGSSYCQAPDGPFAEDTCTTDADCCQTADTGEGGECEETCTPYDNAFYATKTAALWWPWSGHWIELGEQAFERMYHSTAMLLPDGRVLSAGSGQRTGVVNRKEVEFFSPPYKFWGDAPVIEDAPSEADFGSTIEVDVSLTGSSNPASEVHRVTMLRLGSVTHQFDQDQRFIELGFSPSRTDPNVLEVEMPSDGAQMTPGWTMLFVLTDRDVPTKFQELSDLSGGPGPGVPSEGHYLKLRLEDL